MTLGEDRVRTKFNPSASGDVEAIKQKTAELINLCGMYTNGGPEQARLASLAMTAYEEAAMWAVKSVTLGK